MSRVQNNEEAALKLIQSTTSEISTCENAQLKAKEQYTRQLLLSNNNKDVSLPAAPCSVDIALSASKLTKKSLEEPAFNWDSMGREFGDADSTSMIAIIGIVLALQARTNSSYWSTAFQQASASMQMAVSLAPIIGQAVQDNYNNQAAISEQEAHMARADGIFAIGSAITSLAMGIKGAYDAGLEEEAANTGTTVSKGLNNAPAPNPVSAASNPVAQTLSGKLGAGASAAKTSLMNAGKGLFRALEKAATAGQFSMALSNGMAQLFVDSPAKTHIAQLQRAAGSADALSKVVEQYSQYYNQDFSRTEDLRQGSQQNIDTATRLLQSAADSLTQVSVSMFRG